MAKNLAVQNPSPTNSNPVVLTVVVLDEKNLPAVGEPVSISPLDVSKVTDMAGEVRFTLGNFMKYNITASSGDSQVVVPYYVTPNGATRLVVNPKYVKTIEAKLHPWYKSEIFSTVSVVIGLALVVYLIWKLWPRKR